MWVRVPPGTLEEFMGIFSRDDIDRSSHEEEQRRKMNVALALQELDKQIPKASDENRMILQKIKDFLTEN